jgi:multicomponent Na+:H+ antiporter subunit D
MASGFDGGAVLRVTGSVFLGLGGAGKDEGGDDKAPTPQAENKETKYASPGTPLPMILTAFVALLLALAVGLIPQLFAAVKMAAGAFVHAAAAAPGQEMTLSGTLDNVAVTIGAILLAGAALRYPNFKSFAGPLRVLRLAHSGVFTDYVLWITIGVAVYAAFLVPIGVLK